MRALRYRNCLSTLYYWRLGLETRTEIYTRLLLAILEQKVPVHCSRWSWNVPLCHDREWNSSIKWVQQSPKHYEFFFKSEIQILRFAKSTEKKFDDKCLKRVIDKSATDKEDAKKESYITLRQHYMQNDRTILFQQGRYCRLQKERGQQSSVQTQRDCVTAMLSNRTAVQVKLLGGTSWNGWDKPQKFETHRLAWIVERTCKVGCSVLINLSLEESQKLNIPIALIWVIKNQWIYHQKICLTDNDYNQVLMMFDHFTKYAEAVHWVRASAEETSDHLVNIWTARHRFPLTF